MHARPVGSEADSCAGAAEQCVDTVARIDCLQSGGVVYMPNGVVAVKGCTITNASNATEVRDSKGCFRA